MKKLTPLAISVLLALPALAHASAADTLAQPGMSVPGVDDGLAAGLDMMLINTSLMRNGDNVWQRAREGFQLAEVNPELVRRHEQYFTSRPDYLRRSLERSRKYMFFIMNEVEKRGMPTELAFLPIVESSFVPTARSAVGAEGLWQFMPATGREYALEQTWWYDGRRDVMESTRAALDYLQNLYNRFGDWNLALAAYNWGQGNLNRAIGKVRARGESETYENVVMPQETRNYAPKLLAIRNILAQPERFGLRIDVLPNKPAFVAVNTGKHMNIDIAAKLAEMPVAEFKELNPAFNLPVYAYKAGRQMLLPANKLHRFETNLAKWDKPLLTWQVHVPASNESVAEVARNFGMNPGELMAANGLKNNSEVGAGRPVLVAMRSNTDNVPPLESTDVAQPAPGTDAIMMASVSADGTSTPARAVSVSGNRPAVVAAASTVAASTPARAVSVSDSRPAVVAASTVAASTPTRAVSVSDNRPAAAPARAVIVASAQVPAPAKVAVPVQPRVIKVAGNEPLRPATVVENHIVTPGDTLYNISRRYGMTVEELRNLNALTGDAVKLGQTLRVLGEAVPAATAVAAAPAAQINASPLRTVAYQVSARKPTEYVVQSGDTVFSIARKFGVQHSDIQRWNEQLVTNQIRPGQVLRLEDGGL